MEGNHGGIAPHISKREGYEEPPSATIAALPDEYREKLIKNTVRQAETGVIPEKDD